MTVQVTNKALFTYKNVIIIVIWMCNSNLKVVFCFCVFGVWCFNNGLAMFCLSTTPNAKLSLALRL